MVESRSHYQVLGVRPSAQRQEIRQAHRRLVHVLHPDRHVEGSGAERRLAERRMREINQAWYVLSDERRRAEYDREHRVSFTPSTGQQHAPRRDGAASAGPAGASKVRTARTEPASGPPGARSAHAGRTAPGVTTPADHDHPVSGATFLLLRRGPLLALLVVAVGLLLVTAYAGSASSRSAVREVTGTQACVLLLEGSSGRFIDCSLPNDGRVVAEVDAALDCPADTRYVLVESDFVCIPETRG